jgi:hypothetical protein
MSCAESRVATAVAGASSASQADDGTLG